MFLIREKQSILVGECSLSDYLVQNFHFINGDPEAHGKKKAWFIQGGRVNDGNRARLLDSCPSPFILQHR